MVRLLKEAKPRARSLTCAKLQDCRNGCLGAFLSEELLKNKSNENCIIFGFSNNLALPGQLEAGFKLIEIPIRPAVL